MGLSARGRRPLRQAFASLTRTVSLSGQSGTVTALDPLFYPVEGAPLTSFTYTTLGGQPGISAISPGAGGTSNYMALISAVPFAAFNTATAAPSSPVTVEWEQQVGAAATYGGGIMFYHFSGGDHFGTDGAGYLFDIVGTDAFLLTRDNDTTPHAGFATAVGATVLPDTTAGFSRFRATLTNEGGNTKTCKFEQMVSGTWTTIFNQAGVANKGSMFGVAILANSNGRTLNLRGPGGANGPIVTFKAPQIVVAGIGQSEFAGYANAGETANADTNIMSIGWDGQYRSPATYRQFGTAAAATGWTGHSAAPGAGLGGGMVVDIMRRVLAARGGTIIWHAASLASGTMINAHLPPASTTRYLNTSRGGVRDLLTTILAGDGRTPGQTLVLPIWIGTSDAINGTTKASWKADFATIKARYTALFPTSRVLLAKLGDRTFWAGCTALESQDIRDAQAEIIATGDALLWFDDADRVGPVGQGIDWPDVATSQPGHPGVADYAALAVLAAPAIVAQAL